jgi:uncharacterized membrane protein YedE/YeeE
MSSFGAYLLGAIVLVLGLAVAAYLLGLALQWIVVGAVILMGIGIMSAVTHGKRRDLPTKTDGPSSTS